MANFSVQTISGESGADVTLNACNAGGDTFDWVADGRLLIDNADAASKTITLTPATGSVSIEAYGSLTRGTIVITVPATTKHLLKMPPGIFADGSAHVAVSYSAVTNLKMGVVRFG